MNYLENYYSNYDEEGRLLSRHGQVEYLTTMKCIHEIAGTDEKKRILEVGAGTGRYSIALAKEGHTVDESFDLTLVLGPMYHMYTKVDKEKVLQEAIRVTKKGGHIFVAYCMNEATVIRFVFKAGMIWDCINNNMLTDDFRCLSEEKDLFEMVRLEEINELNAKFNNIERLKILAADGAANYMRECIDEMDDATFDMWMKYHFAICERQDLIGAADHSLDILRKKE